MLIISACVGIDMCVCVCVSNCLAFVCAHAEKSIPIKSKYQG